MSQEVQSDFNSAFRREVRNTLLRYKYRWAFSAIAFQVLPFLELGLIGLIYLVLDADARSGISERLEGYNLLYSPAESIDPTLFVIFVIAIFLLLLQSIIRILAEINLVRLRIRIYVSNAQRLVNSYLAMPLEIVEKIGKGRFTSSIIVDCGAIGEIIKLRIDIASACWGLLIYIISAITLSPMLLIIAALIYAIPIYLNRRSFLKMKIITEDKMKSQEKLLSYFDDLLAGSLRSKLDSLEKFLNKESKKILQRSQSWRLHKQQTQTAFRVSTDSLSLFGVLVLIFASIAMLKIELAVLMLLFVIFNRMKAYVSQISQATLDLRSTRPHVDRFIRLLNEMGALWHEDMRPEQTEISAVPISSLDCRDVSFRYGDQQVLDGINLRLEAGDRVIVTGPSGHGKSTLIKILCGLFRPTGGAVYCNGELLDEAKFRTLRHSIAVASPEIHLFGGSLRRNLSMSGAGPDAVERAVRLAQLERAMQKNPSGLDTDLGRNGGLLSLGQRQRAIIARLFLKKPTLVILDEATANLDRALEGEVIEELQDFVGPECIIVMVAHKVPEAFRYNKHFEIADGKLEIIRSKAEYAHAVEHDE